jgi:hypothetical protein
MQGYSVGVQNEEAHFIFQDLTLNIYAFFIPQKKSFTNSSKLVKLSWKLKKLLEFLKWQRSAHGA